MTNSYPIHPGAELFPEKSEADLAKLTADIAVHGQGEPFSSWTGSPRGSQHRTTRHPQGRVWLGAHCHGMAGQAAAWL